jgi:thiol:disulfide interchange protein
MKFINLFCLPACMVLVAFAGCSKTETPANIEATATPALSESQAKTAQAEAPHSEKPTFYTVDHYDAARNPADDLAKTVTRAKAEKKRILIQVGGDWCGWCKLMSRYIETNPKVRETIADNYLVMKVTENGDQKNAPFLSQYPSIPGYPHLFVLDSDGTFLHSQGTSELEEGHGYNETVYLAFLNQWKPAR